PSLTKYAAVIALPGSRAGHTRNRGARPKLFVAVCRKTSGDETEPAAKFASNGTITCESGNSYLAILQWTGLLGAIRFYGIVLFLVGKIARAALVLPGMAMPVMPVLPSWLCWSQTWSMPSLRSGFLP